MARWLVRVPHVALVNLVAGEGVVTELVQDAFTPEALAREAGLLLRGDGERQRAGLAEVRRRLGEDGRQRACGQGRADGGAGGRMKAFRRILRYVKPHIAWALAAVAGMIGVAIASVFMVFLLSPLLDDVLGGRGDVPGLSAGAPAAVARLKGPKVPEVGIVKEMRAWFDQGKSALRRLLPSDAVAILLLGFLAVFVKNVFLYLGHYSLFRAGLATVKDLRDRLMDSLIAQTAGYYQQQPSAVLMSRVTNDVEQINNAISDRLADLLQDFFAVIGFLILVFSLNFRLALATVVLGAAAARADRALHSQAAPPLAPEPGAAGGHERGGGRGA